MSMKSSGGRVGKISSSDSKVRFYKKTLFSTLILTNPFLVDKIKEVPYMFNLSLHSQY